jgi:hypothetical protein
MYIDSAGSRLFLNVGNLHPDYTASRPVTSLYIYMSFIKPR